MLSTLLTHTWATLADAPAAPVLLVTNGGFGAYLGEILRAEGLNAYDQTTIGSISGAALQPYDLVVLGAGSLTSGQAATLRAYVADGGRLLAVRPDAQLIDVFGLGAGAGTLDDGYVRIDTSASFDGSMPGAGLTSETLQIHGPTDRYALAGGTLLANLYADASAATAYPAVVGNVYGLGRAAAFLYDLPRNIVLTRQGNPDNVNLDLYPDEVTRTIELFMAKPGDSGPWLDLTEQRVLVPQADEQMRLFSRLVRQMVAQPLPQLWYFPSSVKTMLLITADAHANPLEWYELEIDRLNAYGADATFYLSPGGGLDEGGGDPTPLELMQTWQAQGHEFAIHPYYTHQTPMNVAGDLSANFAWMKSRFLNVYPGINLSRTVRNHELAWYDYTGAVDLEVQNGMAFDTNYYHSGAWLQRGDDSWAHGYITGSGLPMKFASESGAVLPVYFQETHLVDEQMIQDTTLDVVREELTAAQGFEIAQDMIEASEGGFYTAVMTQFHVDYFNNLQPRLWAENIMAYAQSVNIPMWNVGRWLAFTEARHDANYQNLAWNGITGKMTFDLSASAASGEALLTLLPLAYESLPLKSIRVDSGAPITTSFDTIDVRGVPMVYVSVPAGNHTFAVEYETTYADVEASLVAPASVNAGEQVTYTLTVLNHGEDPATDVHASFTMPPAGAQVDSYNGSGWTCVEAGGTFTCDLSGSIAPSGSASVDFVLDVDAAARGALDASASATGMEPDPESLNNADTATTTAVGSSDLSLDLSGSVEQVLPGRPFTYTLSVSNAGPSTAENLTAVLTLADGATFVSAEGTGWSCAYHEPQAEVVCTYGNPLGVGPANPVVVEIISPDGESNFVGDAMTTSDSGDSNGSNNADTLTTDLLHGLFLPLVQTP